MENLQFADTSSLFLLLLLPFCHRRMKSGPALAFPSLQAFKGIRAPLRVRLRGLPDLMKLLALAAVILALARPRLVGTEREVSALGTDIILALDMSGSMRAEDLKPDRIHAAKEVIKAFIKGRHSDRIGLVAFAGKAYTQAPLTLDYGMLLTLLDGLEIGMIDDGTAIGMAVAEGVKRVKDSAAESRVIILLTDGVNNAGNIDPVTAAKVAKAFGVKVYTIGVGREGGAPIPVNDPIFGKVYARDRSGNILLTEMKEDVLKEVAGITGAKYYRAADEGSLIKIYGEIDSLEKTDVKVKEYHSYTELYHIFLAAALGLLLLSIALRATWLWSYP